MLEESLNDESMEEILKDSRRNKLLAGIPGGINKEHFDVPVREGHTHVF